MFSKPSLRNSFTTLGALATALSLAGMTACHPQKHEQPADFHDPPDAGSTSSASPPAAGRDELRGDDAGITGVPFALKLAPAPLQEVSQRSDADPSDIADSNNPSTELPKPEDVAEAVRAAPKLKTGDASREPGARQSDAPSEEEAVHVEPNDDLVGATHREGINRRLARYPLADRQFLPPVIQF